MIVKLCKIFCNKFNINMCRILVNFDICTTETSFSIAAVVLYKIIDSYNRALCDYVIMI